MLRLLGRLRGSATRSRVLMWLLRLRLRLWVRRCGLQISVGSGIRCAALPKVRLVGATGGSVTLHVGNGVDLGRMTLLDLDVSQTSSLTIGTGTTFEHAARLQLLGGVIAIGEHCELRDGAVLKSSSPAAVLSVGDRVKIGRGVGIHCHDTVTIEDLVTLADRVTVVDSFHDVDGSDTWTMDQPLTTGPVWIERNTIVYSGAVVVQGTTIAANSVIAANALLPSGSHPPGAVMVGNPARRVRDLNPKPGEPQNENASG